MQLSWKLLLFILIICSPVQAAKKPATSSLDGLMFSTAKAEFHNFWQEAKGKGFEIQLSAWNKHIEAPAKLFYEKLLLGDFNVDDRKRVLKEAFAFYENNENKIRETFEIVNRDLSKILKNFKITYPQLKNDFILAVVPTGFHLAKGTVLNTRPPKFMLFLSIEGLSRDEVAKDVLFSHELFHVLHYQLSREKNGEMLLSPREILIRHLWSEGLAVFATHKLFPKKSPFGYFNRHLNSLNKLDLQEVAQNFSKDLKSATKQNLNLLGVKWFSPAVKNSGTSPVQGYFLGYHIVKQIAERHKILDLAKMHKNEYMALVSSALKESSF